MIGLLSRGAVYSPYSSLYKYDIETAEPTEEAKNKELISQGLHTPQFNAFKRNNKTI